VAEITSLLDASRQQFGPAQGDRNHSRTELGIWNFFRQMREDFGRGCWRTHAAAVTSPSVTVASERASSDSAVSPRPEDSGITSAARKTDRPTFIAAERLFAEIAGLRAHGQVRAPTIYHAIGWKRNSLHQHENGPTKTWNPQKLDLVGMDRNGPTTRLFSRESVLRWLAKHFGVASATELTKAGALPAVQPNRKPA
jgi:hypothetical protein